MEPLKIYFLPFMAMGHMIPMVHVARLVAAQGEQVTIITTPSNAKAFAKLIGHDIHIHTHTINFPSKEVGLPEGLENMSSLTDNDGAAKICTAADLLQPQVEALVETNRPHVIVIDIMFTWSGKLTVPRLIFNPFSIFVSSMTHAIKTHLDPLPNNPKFVIPGLPDPITLSVKPSLGFRRVTQDAIQGEENSAGVIVNSFRELESEYADHYERVTGRKVWHVGPALLMLENNDVYGDTEIECLNWLNQQQNDSVLYISFGSLCRFTDEQLLEIASAIEASGHKFLWVVHRKEDGDDDTWLPRGFKERMRTGMLVRGWVPQVKILNHRAVGGFLSQCGWNAMVEAVCAGVPVITMPAFGDHYYIERLIVEVCGFGVEVGGQEWTVSPYDVRSKVVGRERIEMAVRRVMDGGDEALRIRKRAKEWKQKAQDAVQHGGSSHANLTALIREIKHHQKLMLLDPAKTSSTQRNKKLL